MVTVLITKTSSKIYKNNSPPLCCLGNYTTGSRDVTSQGNQLIYYNQTDILYWNGSRYVSCFLTKIQKPKINLCIVFCILCGYLHLINWIFCCENFLEFIANQYNFIAYPFCGFVVAFLEKCYYLFLLHKFILNITLHKKRSQRYKISNLALKDILCLVYMQCPNRSMYTRWVHIQKFILVGRGGRGLQPWAATDKNLNTSLSAQSQLWNRQVLLNWRVLYRILIIKLFLALTLHKRCFCHCLQNLEF